MMLSRRRMYSQRASSRTSILFNPGMAVKSKVSKLLTAGKRGSADSPFDRAAFPVDQFQFDQSQQIAGMIDAALGAFPCHLLILAQHRRQF
jgi:hypothetical protein